MSDEIGTYSFLPWLRLGVANNVTAADLDATVITRATMSVELTLEGTPVEGETPLTATVARDVALYGPGDVVGIDPGAVVRVEPQDQQTNFEPNYLAFIEFYEEDFPWRYTPAAPDLGLHRLRPWLALVVLTPEEFEDAPVLSSRPLPAFELATPAADVFPPAEQLWAWAHVHVNRDLVKDDAVTTSTNGEQASARLETVLKANADHAYSRILAPRRLAPDQRYHAFLVPSFETGRLAGLGLDPAVPNPAFFATLSAWADYPDRAEGGLYPYYKRWTFKTGEIGDFEYLVRLLKPRPPDPRLGRRDMDTQRPGSNLAPIAKPELNGVLRLGGALKVPAEALSDADEAEAQKFEDWDQPFPHQFQQDLAAFINLADDYQRAGDPDPLIVPPLYGRWHALSERILEDPDGNPLNPTGNWFHEANLDPRFRVAAGFGTRVIEDNQEEYMDAAWGQVGDVIAANRRIRLAQLARETSDVWHGKHLGSIRAASAEKTLTLTAPVQRRVVSNGLTVRHRVAGSAVPQAVLSAPFRRILRPRDHVAVKAGLAGSLGREGMIDRLNRGEISAAPPRITPPDLPTLEDVADGLAPKTPLGWLPFLLARFPWLKYAVLVLLLLLALLLAIVAGPVTGFVLGALSFAAFIFLARLEAQAAASNAALPSGNAPDVIDALPSFPGFTLVDPVRPASPPPEPQPGAGRDSPEGARFKVALKDTHTVLDASARISTRPPLVPINLDAVVGATIAGIDPKRTVPAYTYAGITLPSHLVAINLETFVEAMAYPEFDIPMYKPLLGLSDEHFLPNIDKIPPNTITLLETNQRFIEAYMLGLNHAFGGELLWREFPTDQRGSYFRQFWDPSGVMNRAWLSKEALREALRDIPPIHTWSLFSGLGDHDHREAQGDKEEEIVLVIKGDLLKKYPNAVIYAQKARWQPEGGPIDPSLPRIFETEGPERDRLRTPLYEARVPPDITFIGFDLTADEVQGGSGQEGDDAPGWFFVIKERPGEPRFGLDVDTAPVKHTWNDLAWTDVYNPANDGAFLQFGGTTPTIALTPFDPGAGTPTETLSQHDEDVQITWRPGMNAAEIAYVLYQVPVLVGVHGSQILRQ